LANVLPAVRDLSNLTHEAQAAAEVPPGAVCTRHQLNPDAPTPLLQFRDVVFHYPNSDNGLHGVSFDVPRGDITVLTGHSGAGKSTSADVALGLLPPAQGQLLLDGKELEPGDLQWWRSHVAYVPQETILVPGTLRDNLVWSTPGDVSDEECWRVLDDAAATFARAMPEGLDTVLGDRGLRLSGGERQRIAIARGLLRRPSLLVLDEATSSLDDQTEAAVLDLVNSLVPAVTVLVIAHRKSTVDAAHHVVRFDQGRVVETLTRVDRAVRLPAGRPATTPIG
jgi:ATP-binding cassette subfamily C protein